MNSPSLALTVLFGAYAVIVALVGAAALRRAGSQPGPYLVVAWLALTGGLAAAGVTAHFESFPPPILRVVILTVLTNILLCCSPLVKPWLDKWSLAGLIGFQAFRFPLELLMHQAAREGVMPPQMTYTGQNWDILTGLLALPLALWLRRRPTAGPLPWLWNLLGLGLLINVVAVAILSVPGPLRYFHGEPANIWIGDAPFVWLPTVLVQLALAGHILIFRKLNFQNSFSDP